MSEYTSSIGELALDAVGHAVDALTGAHHGTPFALHVLSLANGELRVRSLRGRESISECFRFDIEFSTDVDPETLKSSALGQPATLILDPHHGRSRVVHGVTAALRARGPLRSLDRRLFSLRLVPRLWLLRKQRNSRIFHDMSIVDVITEVLTSAGIRHRWSLDRTYRAKAYCVQYRESDYDFVTRLLREAGIFFFFEPPADLDDPLASAVGAVVKAATGLASAAMSGGLGSVGDVAGAVAGAALGAAGQISGVQETVVFCDVARGYPAIDREPQTAAPEFGGGIGISANASVSISGGLNVSAGVSVSAGTQAASPVLVYRPAEGMTLGSDRFVASMDVERTVRPKSVTVRDYDFKHPLLELSATAKLGAAAPGLSVNVSAGGVSASVSSGVSASVSLSGGSMSASVRVGAAGAEVDAPALIDPTRLEIYEHHGDFEEPDVRKLLAQTLLESHRVGALRGEGTSTCGRLAAGHRFTLDDHPDTTFNREYVLLEITHSGHVPANDEHAAGSEHVSPASAHQPSYENRFVCVPSSVPARPHPKRREIQQVTEVAVVVGPAGEEIYTDEFGRIRVQFPWDRQGRGNERSSCWIRVNQAWAGASFGAQFLPRVGMEVLVTFIGGDVDRPVVTGCLYNALHPTPFELPSDKTRSGWRTHSSPGGAGFNELSFEDLAGAEQIFLHAQRDLDEVVQRNHTLEVLNDETNLVRANQRDTVNRDRIRTTLGNETVTVHKDQSVRVIGNEEFRVLKDSSLTVGGRERREIGEAAEASYLQDHTVRVRGSHTMLVGRHDAKRAYVLHVEGVAKVAGTTEVEISSDKAVVLRCGKSSLRLTPTGIEISAPGIRVAGSDTSVSVGDKLRMDTKGSAVFVADKILLKTKDANVALSKEVKIDGTRILLNSPESAQDPVKDEVPPRTTIELVDSEGNPLANQRFLITLADGSTRSGMSDAEGKAELDLEESATISFPDLSETEKQ